ncbi:MAG: hypothetical protein HUU15_08660 [Candidatus Brocadiae bacterium]|nr:hypothetical protein [Candidatus Brocadiia bacterium]
MSCPPPKPWRPAGTPPAPPAPAPEPAPERCELSHSVCVQCGVEMELVKTKWICPRCRWIIGCCD